MSDPVCASDALAAAADSAPAHPVRLVCWHCGASRDVLTHGPAQFAFEVANWAEQVGMKGFFDKGRGRLLVFCNGDHARQQMTKDGRFRLHPKRPSGLQDPLVQPLDRASATAQPAA